MQASTWETDLKGEENRDASRIYHEVMKEKGGAVLATDETNLCTVTSLQNMMADEVM